MKNTFKAFGLIALVAVIWFPFAACDGDDSGGGGGGGDGSGSGGTLTITNIPAGFNKLTLGTQGDTSDGSLIAGGMTLHSSGLWFTDDWCPISNGKASMPLWVLSGNKFVRYSGNATWEWIIISCDSRDPTGNGNQARFDSVKFSNGSATISWNNKTW